VIIADDHATATRTPIARYARRMTIEQRLAEIVRAFHLDALSSTVNLNIDLDVVLSVLAQALTAAFATATPPPPPTSSNAVSCRPPARSSTATTSPPSGSADAPTHPYSATPNYPPTSPSPGGPTAASTSSTPEPRVEQLRENPRSGSTRATGRDQHAHALPRRLAPDAA